MEDKNDRFWIHLSPNQQCFQLSENEVASITTREELIEAFDDLADAQAEQNKGYEALSRRREILNERRVEIIGWDSELRELYIDLGKHEPIIEKIGKDGVGVPRRD